MCLAHYWAHVECHVICNLFLAAYLVSKAGMPVEIFRPHGAAIIFRVSRGDAGFISFPEGEGFMIGTNAKECVGKTLAVAALGGMLSGAMAVSVGGCNHDQAGSQVSAGGERPA